MFELQLGHPKIIQKRFSEFRTVKDVFLSLFRAEEESIYIFWHQIPVRFRYREDLHHNIDDIIAMAWLLQRDYEGATKVNFMTQLFSSEWDVRWRGDNAQIAAHFNVVDELYEPYGDALNQKGHLDISKRTFLNEWKTLLHQIIVSFKAARVVIEEGTEKRKLEMLGQVEKKIEHYGALYRLSS